MQSLLGKRGVDWMIFRAFAKWILRHDRDEYLIGWKAGVNQHRFEPKSADHGYISYQEYWGEEE